MRLISRRNRQGWRSSQIRLERTCLARLGLAPSGNYGQCVRPLGSPANADASHVSLRWSWLKYLSTKSRLLSRQSRLIDLLVLYRYFVSLLASAPINFPSRRQDGSKSLAASFPVKNTRLVNSPVSRLKAMPWSINYQILDPSTRISIGPDYIGQWNNIRPDHVYWFFDKFVWLLKPCHTKIFGTRFAFHRYIRSTQVGTDWKCDE